MKKKQFTELENAISSEYNNTVGIVIQKDGIVKYENYFNGYTAKDTTHVFSVTKSVFSILIGIAIDKGFIKNVNQKVLDFFPDYEIAEGEKTIQKVTIKDMLTMTAPYKYETEPFEEFFMSQNHVNFALDLLGGEKEIGEFNYSAIVGIHILSGVLTKAIGEPIMDFATRNLFKPLEINVSGNIVLPSKEEHMRIMNDKNTKGWAVDPQGINTASWGLFLSPTDMAKIGQLCLNGGKWDEVQIVSSDWIDESTREHSRWGELSYGYLWWIIDEKELAYAAMGDGGNIIYVNSKKEIVVSIAALFSPNPKNRIELIKKYIEPIFED